MCARAEGENGTFMENVYKTETNTAHTRTHTRTHVYGRKVWINSDEVKKGQPNTVLLKGKKVKYSHGSCVGSFMRGAS